MTAFVDTNVLLRHLTGDPPALAKRAGRYLAAASELLLPDLILAEVAYVLESFYEAPRAQVATALRAILAFPAIRVVDAETLQRTVEIYDLDRLDFADAYLVASAERSGVGVIASFDRSIDRVSTVRRVKPAQAVAADPQAAQSPSGPLPARAHTVGRRALWRKRRRGTGPQA